MAFLCTPEERKLICEMAAWSGMNRQDYIIGRGKALCKRAESVEGLVKEVHLAASYGELSEFLQQRVELVLRFFLALGEPVDAPMEETSPRTTSLEEPAPSVMDAESNTASIFGMGRG